MTPLWLRLLLGISLAFNMAIVLEISLHEPPPPKGMENQPDEMLPRLTRHLSKDDAAKVRAAFDHRQDDFANIRGRLHQDLGAVNAALTADPFDLAALHRTMDDVHANRAAMANLIEESLLESAKNISADGRTKLMPPPREPTDTPH